MKRKDRIEHRTCGFTLVEMIVTIGIVGVLLSLAGTTMLHARARARATQCLGNQQKISSALLTCYLEKGAFPSDRPEADLAIELSSYIPWSSDHHGTALPGVYLCPNDQAGKLSNSYQPYYVCRKEPAGSEYFVLGCPRHTEMDGAYVNTSAINTVSRGKAGAIVINGTQASIEDAVAARSMRTGTMTFDDGSTVTVTNSSSNFSISAVASFRQQDGRLYTIVRVNGTGKADFAVTPGSKFEVVSPVAIIGVRGTTFSVEFGYNYTKVSLHTGAVQMWDRVAQQEFAMKPGEIMSVGSHAMPKARLPLCIQCAEHCKNGQHCDRCPLHVGVPQNIGTQLCVKCPLHCKSTTDHCDTFCPLNNIAAVNVISGN